jgi:hypothetical protein
MATMTRLLAIAFLACAVPALAAPDLRQARRAGPLIVYPDDARRNLFYFPPGDLVIATSEAGEPDVHLLHARYTGSAATGDRGTAVIRSIFTLRLVMSGPTLQQITDARKVLSAVTGGSTELRPLPIRRVESAIVYATAPGSAASPSSGEAGRALPAGHFEPTESAAAAPREGYWTERLYTLGLGPADAQLLSDALERGRLALSVGYAFLADGIGPDEPLQELTGSPELVAELRKRILSPPRVPADGKAPPAPQVVRAGAVGVTADVARWPRIIRRIDINESAPPGYAALDVYCYDFNQGTDSALYETQVEIQAAGVGGRPVTLTAAFSRTQPDLYARSLRFPVAVRMDRPYRFRVLAIAQDGGSKTTPWRERAAWTELLDVTAQGGHQ